MAGLAMRETARRWRGLRGGVGLGGGGFGRWTGRLRQQEKVPQVAQRFAARGMPQAVIADLVEAGRQDVLEEAPDELVAGDGFLTLAVGGAVLVAIGHGLVVDGQDAVVGEGVAEAGAGGERRFGEEEGLAGGMPGGAVIGQSAAGNQAMNVRMAEPS